MAAAKGPAATVGVEGVGERVPSSISSERICVYCVCILWTCLLCLAGISAIIYQIRPDFAAGFAGPP